MRRIVLLVVFLGGMSAGLLGCQSSEPVQVQYENAETTYTTKNVRMSNVQGFSGLKQPRFEMFADATCRGSECRPDAYTLHFRADPGTGRIRIESTSVRLTADDQKITWDDPFPLERGRVFEVRGQIVTVECTPEEFQTIAEAETVSGELGGLRFDLHYGNREPLRALVARVDSL